MSIADRLADADVLWQQGRREGAFLLLLCAVDAAATLAYPKAAHPEIKGVGQRFERFLRDRHGWTISVEYQGEQTNLDRVFYKLMRCKLVHEGTLPADLRIDDGFARPGELSVRAGGAPEYVVLLTAAWYYHLTGIVRQYLADTAPTTAPQSRP